MHCLSVGCRFFPWLAYCKQCCCEHKGMCILSNNSFVWIFAQMWNTGSYGNSVFSFLKNFHIVFYNAYTSLYFYLHSVKGFPFFHTLSSTCYSWAINDGYSNQCEVVLHYNFDLHLSSNEKSPAPFHMRIGHLKYTICF